MKPTMTWRTMTSLMTLLLSACALQGSEGKRGKERGAGITTPFPPPNDQGMFAVVQTLVRQVAEINSKHSRDWSRVRRIERRGKSARHDIDVMHADIIQLRQHVIEINSRLDRLDDVNSDLHLEITKVGTGQQKLREELGKLRRSRHSADDRLEEAVKNCTETRSWTTSVKGRLDLLQSWSQHLQGSQQNVLNQLNKLETKIHHLHAVGKPQPSSASPEQGDLTAEDEAGFKAHTHKAPRSPAPSPDGTVLKELDQLTDTDHKPQRDQSRTADGGSRRTLKDSGFMEDADHDINTSGDGEVTTITEDQGSGEDEFFMIEEEIYSEPGSGEVEVEETEADKEERGRGGGGGKADIHGVTPTPLTTNTVPTLTHPSFTFPTSPLPPCPSIGDFALLQQRVDDLQNRLEENRLEAASSVLTEEDLLRLLNNHTQRVDTALAEREEQVKRVQGNVADLGTTVSRLAGQMASLRLSDFMERLQVSLLNFTANVLTLEQWQVASQQVTNVTEHTQQRLTQLGSRVMDNAQMTLELQLTLGDHKVMSERQYRVLQTHVIRLNNSLQDLQDHVDSLASRKSYPTHPAHSQFSNQDGSSTGQQGAVLTSRVDDLALQLVYSDNRLSHLETQLLNTSLSACRKSNSDLYQDASLLRMDQHLTAVQRDIAVLKDSVKRLDLGLYRLHGNSKANQEAVRKVKGQMKDVTQVAGKVDLLRSEVDNLLFQLPVDCHDYYQRGYRHSGDYIIYPRDAVHSLKVRCVMHATRKGDDGNDDDDDDGDKEGGKKKPVDEVSDGKGEGGEEEEVVEEEDVGGWTVIHQRHSGKVNFTRSWAEYAVGFGTTDTEYWLGNEHLHLLSAHRNYTLTIDLTDIFGGHWRATYQPFSVSGKDDHYRLNLGRYRGNATDTLRYSSGMTFSTYDKDTDVSSSPCARYNGGGWWYSHCQISNLNGPYEVGMIWFHKQWRDWLQLRQATMRIKPFS